MYNNYNPIRKSIYTNSRFLPFAGPFLLGALTGGVAIQAFNNKPYYQPYYQPYMPYYY